MEVEAKWGSLHCSIHTHVRRSHITDWMSRTHFPSIIYSEQLNVK